MLVSIVTTWTGQVLTIMPKRIPSSHTNVVSNLAGDLSGNLQLGMNLQPCLVTTLGPEFGGTRVHMGESDGLEICANASSMHRDMLNASDNTKLARNNGQNARMLQKKLKWQNLPASATRQAPDKSSRLRDHADRSNVFMDAQKQLEMVRKHQMKLRTQNSPHMTKIETSRSTDKWIRASIGDDNVLVPRRYAVEVLGTASQPIIFGRDGMQMVEVTAAIDDENKEAGGDGGQQQRLHNE